MITEVTGLRHAGAIMPYARRAKVDIRRTGMITSANAIDVALLCLSGWALHDDSGGASGGSLCAGWGEDPGGADGVGRRVSS